MLPGRTLPPDCEETLYLAVYSACTVASEILDRAGTVDIIQSANDAQPRSMVFSLVLGAVYRALQDYAHSENDAHSPASRLPPEVLCSIFVYLPLTGRISTSHVCHSWRNASLAFPAKLWDYVPRTSILDTMAPLLDRTAALGLPVDLVHVELHTRRGLQRKLAICELLKRHMWHVRTLRLYLSNISEYQHGVESLLEFPAPMLRHFSLSCPYGALSFPIGLFGGHAPNLQQIEFESLDYYQPGLETLYLSALADAAFPRISHICLARVSICPGDPQGVWTVLQRFPALRSLEISTIWFLPLGGRPGDEKLRPLLALDRLAIRISDDSVSELAVLDMEFVLNIRSICVAPYIRPLPGGVVAFLLAQVPQRDFEMETIFNSKSFSLRLRERASGRTRTFLQLDPHVLSQPSLWESTFGAVTSLTLFVSADFRPEDWTQLDFTPCSNVEHLTLANEVWREDCTIAVFSAVAMTLPRLTTLTLLASGSPRPILDANALRSTILRLRYTAPKLEILSLCGITVRPTPAPLYDVAEGVRFEDEGYYVFPDLWAD